MNENEKQKSELQDISNYGELTSNDKATLEMFIDFISALDESMRMENEYGTNKNDNYL